MKDEDFVKMLEELQRKIEFEEEKTYSKIVIQEYRSPSNFGVLEVSDAIEAIKGPCGDTMKISLRVEDGRIIEAFFWTDGCGATIACGSMLTKMIKGKTIKEAADITSMKLTKALEGLPKEHNHCSKLAVNTLQKVLKRMKTENNVI